MSSGLLVIQVPRFQVSWYRSPTIRRILFVAKGDHGIEPRCAARW